MVNKPIVLDPERLSQLPLDLRRLVEEEVPRSEDLGLHWGILSGLEFAFRLLQVAPCPPEQIRDALGHAVAVAKERVRRHEQKCLPALYAKYKKEFTAEQLAEYANVGEEMVPFEQVLKELDERPQPRNGATG